MKQIWVHQQGVPKTTDHCTEEKYLGVASLCRRWKRIGFVGAVEWGRLVEVATLQALVMSLLKTACNQPMPSVGTIAL